MILNLLADKLDVPNEDELPHKPGKTNHDPADQSQSGPNVDWDFNTHDVLQCVEDGKAAPVGFRNGSPAPYSTGSLIMSISWR